jgi:hypothetical protein
LFEGFEFPIINGLEYLINENLTETDFLLINEPSTDFSLMFEKDFPIFKVPENSERDYCLFELKRSDRVIKFFCPERHKNLDTAVWYFCMELFDESGNVHTLPGQVRVEFDGNVLRQTKGKPQFIEVLEQVKLTSAAASA